MSRRWLAEEIRDVLGYSKEKFDDIERLIILQKASSIKNSVPTYSTYKGRRLTEEQVKQAFASQGTSLDDISQYVEIKIDKDKVSNFQVYTEIENIKKIANICYFDAYDHHKADPNDRIIVSCIFYTKKYVYFTVVYDGYYHIDFLPRNPIDCSVGDMKAFGGGSGSTDICS